MSQDRKERARDNWGLQGGRPKRRTVPTAPMAEASSGPGKRADERVASISIDEILPDRYQGRLRWPVELGEIERLYGGEWDAQDFLDHLEHLRYEAGTPALDEAWESIQELARSILSEGQVAPITVAPARDLPVGYRFVIETGEGRFWAYQMMRWLLKNAPERLGVESADWREDPAFIRALVVTEPSRLRQVAENEQRQSYASAVDRAIAYASMVAEEAGYSVDGAPPGLRNGSLELPDAYWRAARRGLRGLRDVVQQVPSGTRQLQRHLKLLTDLDPQVLALAKQHGLSEAQLRPLVGQPPEEQRHLAMRIVEEGLSSRDVEALGRGEMERTVPDLPELVLDEESRKVPLTPPEEVARLLRSLTTAAARYESLRRRLNDEQIEALLELELASYETTPSRRRRTPRRRLQRLIGMVGRVTD